MIPSHAEDRTTHLAPGTPAPGSLPPGAIAAPAFGSSQAAASEQVALRRALALAQGPGTAEDRLIRVCAELRAAIPESPPPRPAPLSERQTQTLHLLAEGLSNRSIARRLDIAEETVKSHVRALLDRLNLPNRTSLALWAIRHGVVALHPAPVRAHADFPRG